MTFSLFGDKFTRHSGITLLMEDLNDGLRTPGAIMLGGGNPAQIPEMQDYFQTLLTDMLESGKRLMHCVTTTVHRGNGATHTACRNAAREVGLGYRTTEYCTNKRQPERVFLLI
ncbi:class I and II aminotransferase [Escherichia coli]|uniref:Class I and II aminotransferase n=1 Tax=Escherichia coli TaxID=562 RepID=A0A2X1NMD7_ECOLX|nr:class I and II aminotransferase [Escherichia coli]